MHVRKHIYIYIDRYINIYVYDVDKYICNYIANMYIYSVYVHMYICTLCAYVDM